MADEAKARMVDTQNMARKGPGAVGRQRMANDADRRLPGESLIEEAAGEVKEGSFRACAWNMDKITGPAQEGQDLTEESNPE
jgi:hypothetical protein